MQLRGKILIAMPGMGDPRFESSVVYLCAHSDDGALGLIVNKPAPGLSFRHLLRQLKIAEGDRSRDIRVHFGGPVENGRGFVLHTADYQTEGTTLIVDGEFGMTATTDILEAMARGEGPEESILALGYAGWGPGQLEDEIMHNGWLVGEADRELLLGPENRAKWVRALTKMGIDPIGLSASAGRA